MGYNSNSGPNMAVPSAGSRALITSVQSALNANPPGQTVRQKGNVPVAVKLRTLPWPDLMHNQLFEGMVIAANSVKSGIPAHLTVVAPLGYINAASIRNYQNHEADLARLLPQINQSWYESPIRGLLEKHREKNLSKEYYGPSSLETAQRALDEHKEAMRRNNNAGMQAIMRRLEEELNVARANKTEREKYYREFDEKVRRDRKNEYSTCTVGRLISEWKVLGAVLSITTDKRDELTQNTLNTRTTVGVAAAGFTNTLNVWSNRVTLGTYLWFIVKPQKRRDGTQGAPVFIPWENPIPFDKSEPPLSVREYDTEQGLWEHGPAILYGMVAELPLSLSKSDHFKSTAMGLSGESWNQIRDALSLLDMLKVQQIKKRNVYF